MIKIIKAKILSVGLVILLTMVLCACGGGAERGEEGSSLVDSEPGTVSPADPVSVPGNVNAALAKENVFRVNEMELPKLADDSRVGVECTAYWDEKIYAVMEIRERGESGSKSYCVLSMDEVGDILQTAFLEFPGNDGGKETAEPDADMQKQHDTCYSDFVIGADGRVYALCQYEYSFVDDSTEQFVDERHLYVCCWGTDGRLLLQSEVCADSAEDLSVWSIFPTADGSLELIITGENAYRLHVEKDGSLSESDKYWLSEETAKALGNCRRLIRKADGSCLLLCREREGGLSLMKYDVESDTLGEVSRLPDGIRATSLSDTVFAAGVGSDLIYAGRDGVFVWNMGDEEASLKMNYINSDRNISTVHSLLELDECDML